METRYYSRCRLRHDVHRQVSSIVLLDNPVTLRWLDWVLTASSSTAVAFSTGPSWNKVKIIQHWPSPVASEPMNKVPTQLVYQDDGLTVKRWGKQCDQKRDDIKQWFKLHLEPGLSQSNESRSSHTHPEAVRYFVDYIYCVYKYVVEHLEERLPGFNLSCVEFLFSIPTTWKNVQVARNLKHQIKLDTPLHRARIGLTEAEAAAVCVNPDHYNVRR